MGKPGPAKRPALAVVREGNPSHRPVPEQIVVPPATFDAPEWMALFPEQPEPEPPEYPDRTQFEGDGGDAAWYKALDRYESKLAKWEKTVLAIQSAKFSRRRAAEEWDRIVPVLKHSVGLGNCDYATVVDLCVCIARLEWCEFQISIEGLIVHGQRGPCRNPLTTVASQYRAQFKTYIRELGLSPSARTGVPSIPGGSDEDDPFDK